MTDERQRAFLAEQEWVTFYASLQSHPDFSPAPTLGNWESQAVQLREVF